MSNPIKIKRSNVPSKVPTVAQLVAGELAMNTADKRMFFSNGAEVTKLANLDDLTGLSVSAQDCAAVQLRRSTTQSLTTTSTDITFNLVDFANDTTSLAQGTTTSQIVAKKAGLHWVQFECEVINTTNAQIDYFQIKVNGTALAQGLVTVNTRTARQRIAKGIPVYLNANDYVTVAAYSSGTTGVMQIGATLTAFRVQGLPGPAGANGAMGGQSSMYYGAATFDNPNNANWAVNALAPVTADTANAALNVRAFDDTAEEGVGCTLYIPPSATGITFNFVGKAATAPATAKAVMMNLYKRQITIGAAVAAWSTAYALTAFNIGTNVFYQTYTQTFSLAALGLVAGQTYQLEFTRNGASASDTLVGDFYLLQATVAFA